MSVVRAAALLLACLGLQVGLVRLAPTSPRYVDFLVLPVLWYGIRSSQRSAMLVGCAGGLLRDAWFSAGVLGLNGFTKTFLGWVLGGLGARVDLNSGGTRLVVAAAFSVSQSALDLGLRRLLDRVTTSPDPVEWAVRAVTAGLLVAVGFPILDRVMGTAAGRSAR